jgi:hypothetical protein
MDVLGEGLEAVRAAVMAALRFVLGTWMGWLLLLVLAWAAVSDRMIGTRRRRKD